MAEQVIEFSKLDVSSDRSELRAYIAQQKYPSYGVRKEGGISVIVLGALQNPGIYNIDAGATLEKLLSTCGPFKQHASLGGVMIISLHSNDLIRVRASPNDQSAVSSLQAQRFLLKNDDLIYIPELFGPDLFGGGDLGEGPSEKK